MLVVPTYVSPSRIDRAGMGLFAQRDITAGAIVWKRAADSYFVIDRQRASLFPEVAQAFLRTYATLRENGWNLAFDNGRFINHSDAPNLAYDYAGNCVAIRKISAGEELTEDYRLLGEIEPLPEGDPLVFSPGSMT